MLLVEVDDDLGVAVGRQAVAGPQQLAAQLGVVVDLAVEDDDDRAVLVVDRLVAGVEVDDPQPLDAEADAARHVQAARVRPAVLLGCAHADDQLLLDRRAVGAHLARDATHQPVAAREASGSLPTDAAASLAPDRPPELPSSTRGVRRSAART